MSGLDFTAMRRVRVKHQSIYPSYFLIPALLLYSALFILPSLLGFGFSLTNWNSYSTKISYIGFENFKEIFSVAGRSLSFLANTLKFAAVTTILKVGIGLMLALAVNHKLKTKSILRTVFYLPVVLSPLVIGLVFTSIFHPVYGLLNRMLSSAGLEGLTRQWLTDISTAMGAVMSVEVWRLSGYCMVIFLAGLQGIPNMYYEAAEIDGANAIQKFMRITLPFLKPAFTVNIILNIIRGLKVFDIIFVLTRGGPGYATGVMNTAVFYEFSAGRYGFATALGVVIFLITTVVAFAVLGVLNRNEEALA